MVRGCRGDPPIEGPLKSGDAKQLDRSLEAAESGGYDLDLSWWPEDEPRFTVGWYSGKGIARFNEKISQFPPGSHFRTVTTNAQMSAHEVDFAEAERAVSRNGQVLELVVSR